MTTKDLHQKLKDVTTDVPELVGHYKSANKRVHGKKIVVAKYTHKDFWTMQHELQELGIPLRTYAYGVTTLLKSWVEKKKLRQLPTNVFLGQWALKQFRKVYDAEFADFHYDEGYEDELLYTELQVARYYINMASVKFARFRDCVAELQPILDVRWVALYEAGDREDLVNAALGILEEEYNINVAKSYADIVDAKVLNGG